MQIADAPHALSATLYALIGAAVMAFINFLFNRGKNKADTNLSNALARKAEVESNATAFSTFSNALTEIRNLKDELSIETNKRTVVEAELDKALKRVEELEEALRIKGNGKAH